MSVRRTWDRLRNRVSLRDKSQIVGASTTVATSKAVQVPGPTGYKARMRSKPVGPVKRKR